LGMWDPEVDLDRVGVDVPCNVTATVQLSMAGQLDLTVFCRSNDIIWGCYGANAVHFSVLQEYLARALGVEVGKYWQVSINWHGYRETFEPLLQRSVDWLVYNPYTSGKVEPYPLMRIMAHHWDEELSWWLLNPTSARTFLDPFFPQVAVPIMRSHKAFKSYRGMERFVAAEAELASCRATDWRLACTEWLRRRQVKYLREMDDGPSAE